MNGETVVHMQGKFSTEGIKTYVNEVSVISGAALPVDNNQMEIDAFLKLLEAANIDLWIRKESPLVTKMTIEFESSVADIQATLNGTDSEASLPVEGERLPEAEGTIKFSLSFTGKDFGVEKTIDIPVEAEEFIPEEMFGDLASVEPVV